MKNKKTIIVALVAVAVIALIGGTLAYFASTATVQNTYSSSSYETVVERNLGGLSGIQPGDVITLDNLKVKNQGSNSIGVRAKIEGEYFIEEANKSGLDGAAKETVAQAANASMNTISGNDAMAKTYGSDWKVGNDGWYYYDGLVSPSSDTTTNFITSLTFNAAATNNYNCYYATISNDRYIIDESKRNTPVDSLESNNVICVSEAEQGEVNYANADYKIYVTFETIQGTAVSSVWGSSIPAAATTLSSEAASISGAKTDPTNNLEEPEPEPEPEPTKVLYEIMAENAVSDTISSTYVTNSNGIEFNQISSDTNGKGIYDFGNGIYYYRGAVDNNNVLFDDKCWQIIRTTASGTVKMIYNGVPSNGTCPTHRGSAANATTLAFNSHYDDVNYAKYRISEIKTYIEGTFLSTISAAAQAKLATTTFYLEGDTITPASGTFSGNVKKSYVPANRIWGFDQTNGVLDNIAANAQVELMTKSKLYIDRGNDTYNALVGLIQADEAILAGGRAYGDSNNDGANSTYYLYSGGSYWTISPWGFYYDGVANAITVRNNGYVYANGVRNSGVGVRPVVSLKSGIEISSGDGTTLAPYQINVSN